MKFAVITSCIVGAIGGLCWLSWDAGRERGWREAFNELNKERVRG